ncbi:MAG: hypothetical protein J6T32_05415 [Paludibacteraceae bacterium]|nr:hypothetical protein [Paludibacteraceae bacterium]
MKKILVIAVTYHSNKELQAFLESVRRAAEKVKNLIQVDVEVVDNGQDNKGYLGGALPIYNEKAHTYDYVSISNVDLQLAEDFFEQLLTIDTKRIGWLAPDIYTDKINRHENPFMLTRPTKRNFLIWRIIYSTTWIYRIYHRLYLWKNRKQLTYTARDIYAGHGSFMLFTKNFVTSYPELHFPGFMYGEEIYLAELHRAAQLKTIYVPILRIANTGNINTALINQKQKSAWSRESLHAIYKHFFA